ncbi:uncharacterized protein, partial [Physcomitrium patens]|uniref:uncharacterized protein n=1 Tax=Physcomitrium patens TaxID=3218 RepID=UPI000D155B70
QVQTPTHSVTRFFCDVLLSCAVSVAEDLVFSTLPNIILFASFSHVPFDTRRSCWKERLLSGFAKVLARFLVCSRRQFCLYLERYSYLHARWHLQPFRWLLPPDLAPFCLCFVLSTAALHRDEEHGACSVRRLVPRVGYWCRPARPSDDRSAAGHPPNPRSSMIQCSSIRTNSPSALVSSRNQGTLECDSLLRPCVCARRMVSIDLSAGLSVLRA